MGQKLRLSSVYGLDNTTLVNAVIGLARDVARQRVESSNFTDFTDNTTGTAAASGAVAAVATPVPFVKTGTDLAPKAGFDTALGGFRNAQASMADSLNPLLATLGAPQLSYSEGTPTVGTIPALTKVLTAVDGTGNNGLAAADGADRINKLKANLSTIVHAVNTLAAAVGYPLLTNSSGGVRADNGALVAVAATGTGVAGTTAAKGLSDTAVDAALTALANGYATAISWVNAIIGVTATDLTGTVGGTASDTVAAIPALTGYTATGTDIAPKAGFDTEVALIENNLADLTARANLVRARFGLPLLTDSTGATANTALEALAAGLTAVDGTGSNGLDVVSGNTTITAIKNNVATLVSAVNAVADDYGLASLVDSSGGTVSSTLTIVNVPASGAGVTGAASSGVADTQMDAALVVIRNAITSLQAKLNGMTGTQSRPLEVVVTAG